MKLTEVLRGGRAERNKVVMRFPLNTRGRDFIVGDIHGMFRHLEILLEDIDFDGERDRLFSVGDLVDRGPESHKALDWLDQPWFFACRGNHEQFAIDSTDSQDLDFWVRYNGGEWWLDLSFDDQQRFRKRFSSMPMALEVETSGGTVGIVHADVPPSLDWQEFLRKLEAGDQDMLSYAMLSRYRVYGGASNNNLVPGIDRVYCGHTPVKEPVALGNVHFIDTAAVYVSEQYADARLTLVEIEPGPHQEHYLHTDRNV